MSFDAYSVAVKLSLFNGMSAGLSAIAQDFIGLNKHIAASNLGATELEAKLLKIKNLTLVGGAVAGAGVGMLMGLRGPLDEALAWERQMGKLQQMGLGRQQMDDAKKFVQATEIMGTSMQDRMRLFVDAQGAFRESGKSDDEALHAAKFMMPVMAKFEAASEALTGSKHAAADMAMKNLGKTVEIMGGLGNTAYAKEIANGVFKAVQSSGRMVDERQLKQFVAYGGSATNQMLPRAIFGGMEPIIGELGGSTAAVGLRTAYTRTNGMMSLPPKLMLHEMQRLGMMDATGHKQNKELADKQSHDPIAYALDIMARYDKAGIRSQTDRERENAILFGTNGSKVYNKIMSQMDVLQESLHAYDKAHDIDQTLEDQKDGPLMAIKNFHSAVHDLGLEIGQSLLPTLTPLVKEMGSFFHVLGEHPALIKVLTFAFVGLGSAMAIGGTIALLRGAFSAVGLAAGAGGGLTAVLGGLGTALTGPLGVVVAVGAGIAALGAFAYALKQLWDANHHEGVKLTPAAQEQADANPGALKALDWEFRSKLPGTVPLPMPAVQTTPKLPGAAPAPTPASEATPKLPEYDLMASRQRPQESSRPVQLVLREGGRPLADVVSKVQGKQIMRPSLGGGFDMAIHEPDSNMKVN